MALQPLVKPPEPLCLEDRTPQGDNWKKFKRDWTYYEIAAKINKEDGTVKVCTPIEHNRYRRPRYVQNFQPFRNGPQQYLKGSTRIRNKVCPCHKCYI